MGHDGICQKVPHTAGKRSSYGALSEGLFCSDSFQFLSVAQVCRVAPTAREFLAVCVQQWAVSVACLLCGSSYRSCCKVGSSEEPAHQFPTARVRRLR